MQIRGNTQIIAGTIYDAQIAASAAIASSKLADGANWIKKDGSVAFTAAQSLGGFKLTNVADPTVSTDAATKNYVDTLATTGLSVKAAVDYLAIAGNVTLSGLATQANGDWGVALTAGMRVLVMANTTATENGVYTVAAGAWTRATDFNSSANILPNSFFFVGKGTSYADTGWTLTTDGTITPGSTAMSFSQFSAAGTITVSGTSGLTKAGSALSFNAGNGLEIVSNNVNVKLADSTLAVSAAGVKLAALTSTYMLVGNGSNVATGVAMSGDATMSNTGVVTLAATVLKQSSVVANEIPTGSINGSNTAFNLANTPVTGSVQVYLNGVKQKPTTDYTIATATITFVTAPSTGDYVEVIYFK
jgi:hypothetical protein